MDNPDDAPHPRRANTFPVNFVGSRRSTGQSRVQYNRIGPRSTGPRPPPLVRSARRRSSYALDQHGDYQEHTRVTRDPVRTAGQSLAEPVVETHAPYRSRSSSIGEYVLVPASDLRRRRRSSSDSRSSSSSRSRHRRRHYHHAAYRHVDENSSTDSDRDEAYSVSLSRHSNLGAKSGNSFASLYDSSEDALVTKVESQPLDSQHSSSPTHYVCESRYTGDGAIGCSHTVDLRTTSNYSKVSQQKRSEIYSWT